MTVLEWGVAKAGNSSPQQQYRMHTSPRGQRTNMATNTTTALHELIQSAPDNEYSHVPPTVLVGGSRISPMSDVSAVSASKPADLNGDVENGSGSPEMEIDQLMRCCVRNQFSSIGKRAQLLKMLTLTMIPIASLLCVVSVQVVETTQQAEQSRRTREALEFSTQFGNLIHNLQRERDWTALFLSSIGSETTIFLRDRYTNTDAVLEDLAYWPDDSGLESHYRSAVTLQLFLEKHRNELTTTNSLYDEIIFYTDVINTFIAWIYDRISASRDGELWNVLVAYLLMILAKEDVGIERTLGGVYFARASFQSFNDYLWYLDKYYTGVSNFNAAKNFEPYVYDAYQEVLVADRLNVTYHVGVMRSQIFNSSPCSFAVGNNGSWLLSTWWFDNVTVIVDAMYGAQTSLADIIRTALDESVRVDTQAIFVNSFVMTLVLIISPVIVIFIRTMVTAIQRYALTLAAQTRSLNRERRRADSLLHQMLPKTVANQLKQNRNVTAESFDSTTVFFSDVVGFTTISSESSPLQVVRLLNDLYTCFDSRIASYDVYKVETIGDAYMVASGVPKRSNQQHVTEIATMALDLLHNISHLDIPHQPGVRMKLRAGIHSGAVVAGVVGIRMPRYCLFGDTVNTASRMESNGLPNCIHISQTSYTLLTMSNSGFSMIPRGEMAIKGKGHMMTYFLLEKTGFLATLPCMPGCPRAEDCDSSALPGAVEDPLPANPAKLVPSNVCHLQDETVVF